jgi:hypothetical protein
MRVLTIHVRLPDADVLRHWPSLPRLERLTVSLKALGDMRHASATHRQDICGRFVLLWQRCGSASVPFHVVVDWDVSREFGRTWSGDGILAILPAPMLGLFASCPGLVRLQCAIHVPARLVNAVWQDAAVVPFRHMERLAIYIDAVSTPTLFTGPLLESLTHLMLTTNGKPDGVLSTVSRMEQLQVLDVFIFSEQAVEFMADELLQLNRLTHLRKFVLTGKVLMQALAFKDDHLAQLISRLPHLVVWAVSVKIGVSPRAFILFGKHCRQLRTLDLAGATILCPFEEVVPDTFTPLFPELRTFVCAYTTGPTPLNPR